MKNNLLTGLIKENPIFVLLLGLCPVLAVSTTVENAIVMSLSVLFVLLGSNLMVSLIKNLVPNHIRLPVYILIIATLVTITELVLKAYTPDLYRILGIYIPLIVVNCLVLGRAVGFASKEGVLVSIVDAVGFGLGFMIGIVMLAIFREVLGNNTITIMDNLSKITGYKMVYQLIPNTNIFPVGLLITPAGAFISLGLLSGILKMIQNKRREER
ncbi:MAG: electron transport complex subunit RsxE [Bacilli bacterium]|nr:electron transport complex subunit RsxE [Bacilli bacterium]